MPEQCSLLALRKHTDSPAICDGFCELAACLPFEVGRALAKPGIYFAQRREGRAVAGAERADSLQEKFISMVSVRARQAETHEILFFDEDDAGRFPHSEHARREVVKLVALTLRRSRELVSNYPTAACALSRERQTSAPITHLADGQLSGKRLGQSRRFLPVPDLNELDLDLLSEPLDALLGAARLARLGAVPHPGARAPAVVAVHDPEDLGTEQHVVVIDRVWVIGWRVEVEDVERERLACRQVYDLPRRADERHDVVDEGSWRRRSRWRLQCCAGTRIGRLLSRRR